MPGIGDQIRAARVDRGLTQPGPGRGSGPRPGRRLPNGARDRQPHAAHGGAAP